MYGRFSIFLFSIFLFSCGKPVANFTVSSTEKIAPAKVTFQNNSKLGESYIWNFGDGESSEEESPVHKYFSSGNYTVKLTTMKGDKQSTHEEKVIIEAPKDCFVLMETSMGSMTIQLFNDTPKHRDNFVALVEKAYYDDLLFHRVINGFMVQGGDPRSRNANENTRLGSGGPNYKVDAEILAANVHLKGALCAARQGDQVNPEKKSSGSQFYIVQGQKMTDHSLDQMEKSKGIEYTEEQRNLYKELGGTPQLDMEYTVFGKVVEGLDVIDKIAATKTALGDRPLEDVKMKISFIN